MNNNINLNNNLKLYRVLFGYTQSDVAKLVGVSKNAISDFENNKYLPSLTTAFAFCRLFECSIEDLFYVDD